MSALGNILLALLTIGGVAYFVLAVLAYAEVKPEEKGKFFSPLLWMNPGWPYDHKEKYLPSADRYLLLGKIVFPLLVIGWIAWWRWWR